MKRFLPIVLSAILIISCSSNNLLDEYNCKIVRTEEAGSAKRSLIIRTQTKLSEDELKDIALYLRSKNKRYERLFILYYLPDTSTSSAAWATTHFNPSLEIKIQGTTKDEENVIMNVDQPSGEIIGKWYNSTVMAEHSIVIYLDDGQYKQVEKYKDGSSNERFLTKSEENGMVKFVYANDFGEYYLIKPDNSLGLYDSEGFISTSYPID